MYKRPITIDSPSQLCTRQFEDLMEGVQRYVASPPTPTQRTVGGEETEVKVSIRDRLIAAVHAAAMKVGIVGVFTFICTLLAYRGPIYVGLFYLVWGLAASAFRSTPWSTLSSLWHFWKQITITSCLGGMIIGIFVGSVAAVTYTLNGHLSVGVCRLLLRAIPNINYSSRVDSEATFEYKSDLFLVMLIGTVVGSLATPVVYALRHFGHDIGYLAEDPTLPIVTTALGAICGTVFECMKVWRAEEKEKRLAADTATEGLKSEENMQEKADMVV